MFSNKEKTREFFDTLLNKYNIKFSYELSKSIIEMDKLNIYVSQNEYPIGELSLFNDFTISYNGTNISDIILEKEASEKEMYYFLMEQVLISLAFASISIEEYLKNFFESIIGLNENNTEQEYLSDETKNQLKLLLIEQKKSINNFYDAFNESFAENLYDQFNNDLNQFILLGEK